MNLVHWNFFKVVESQPNIQLVYRETPLPAYQYFENVRNFLVAVEDLKLPAFEASDLERVTYLDDNMCFNFWSYKCI